MLGDKIERDVREVPVPVADHEVGFSGHAGMNRVIRKVVAKNRIVRIGGQRANQVARFDNLDVDGETIRKVFLDLALEEFPNVAVAHVSGRITLLAGVAHQVLPHAFGNDDDGVRVASLRVLLLHHALQRFQQPTFAPEREGHLRNQHEVDIGTGE